MKRPRDFESTAGERLVILSNEMNRVITNFRLPTTGSLGRKVGIIQHLLKNKGEFCQVQSVEHTGGGSGPHCPGSSPATRTYSLPGVGEPSHLSEQKWLPVLGETIPRKPLAWHKAWHGEALISMRACCQCGVS